MSNEEFMKQIAKDDVVVTEFTKKVLSKVIEDIAKYKANDEVWRENSKKMVSFDGKMVKDLIRSCEISINLVEQLCSIKRSMLHCWVRRGRIPEIELFAILRVLNAILGIHGKHIEYFNPFQIYIGYYDHEKGCVRLCRGGCA